MKNLLKKITPILLVIILWIIGNIFINPFLLPKISNVMFSFINMIRNGILINDFLYSFFRITIASILSMIISVILCFIIINNKIIDILISPIICIIKFLPITAFYPLLMMWLGINELMKISFLFLATLTYFLPALVLIIKNIDQSIIDSALMIGITKNQLPLKIILPYILPDICKMYLNVCGIGWAYIVIVESSNTNHGLGYLINDNILRGNINRVFVCIIFILLFSYLFDNICNLIIKNVFKWKII